MKALRYMGTPWVALVLGLLMTFVYMVMSFGDAPYEPFVEFLLSSAPGLLLYIGLILNLMAWSILAARDRFSLNVLSTESVSDMDESVLLPAESGIGTLKDAGEWFERMGFRPRESGEGIEARQGRYGILPGIVLRAGLSLLMLAALMSHHMRQSQDAVVAMGGSMDLNQPAELFGMSVKPVSIDAGLPEEFLDLGKVSFRVENISVGLNVNGDEFTVTGGYPTGAGGIYWRVRHLGYAQPVQYGGVPVSLMLDVFPPGNAYAGSLTPGAQVYEFRLAPEKAIKKGLITGDVFDLRTPRYELSHRGGKGGKQKVRAGETVVIDGRKAAFGSPGYYVRLQAVRDPATPLLRLGFYLTALGLLLMIARLFWYERRMAAVMHEGRVLVGYSEEFYRKWGIFKFRKWTAPLL